MKTYHWSCHRYALLSSIVVALLSPCASSSSPTAPTHLRSFDKVHPVGTDSRPYFGWYVNDPDDDEIQMAYQILVATSQDKLDAGQGDLWDSGQVKSAAQNYVYHEGRALAHGRRYYWKVRTWDKNGNVSPYSAPGQFDTGLFTTRHWAGAKWIKRDTEEADDYTYYRRQVLLPDHTIQRAIVYVTAGHNYELYLNGTLVGQGLAYHYPQYHYYNAYDVTSALTSQTDNTFAALTHWYGGGQGRARGARGFLLKAVIEYGDGTTTVIGTDRHWKQTRAEAWVTGQRQRNGEGVGYVDRIDARKLMPGWQTGEYDDSAWSAATEIGAPPVAPWTSSLQPDLTRVIEEEIVPVSVTGLGGGTYVIDLGKVYAGMPKITFSGGESGTTVNMRGGYTLNDDGTVSTRTDQNTTMSYYFVLDGGTAVFHPRVYLGMRYLQVDNAPKPLTINSVRFVRRHYELDRSRSSFRSSNPMLNQVWDLMKHSLTLGAQETFVDTPTREKAGFLGDAWSQGVAAMTTMGDRTMNLRVLLEFLDSQDQYWLDGRLNAVYPNSDGRRDIPDYTQSYLVWVWDYFMQTGNTEFLRANYNRLRKIGDYVDAHRHESTGLIHNLAGGGGDYLYGIIDWPPQMRYGYDMSVASRTVINAYACVDYDILARIATVLGHGVDRERYTKQARAMRRAINTHLLTARGVYCDGLNADGSRSPHISQHANMFPLALGIVPDAHYASVLAAVKERQMSVGMVTVRWLTEALGESDQGPHLMRLYTDTDWDGWARTILLGATATWESWNADTNGQSMSHPWGAAGLTGIHQYILGIRPLKPQHELVQVKPLAFGTSLSGAAGTLPTDRGDISVDWNRNNERFLMTVTLPDNVTARVYLPKCGISGAALKVDGVEVTGTEEDGYVFLDNIGSGIHTFERAAAPRGSQ